MMNNLSDKSLPLGPLALTSQLGSLAVTSSLGPLAVAMTKESDDFRLKKIRSHIEEILRIIDFDEELSSPDSGRVSEPCDSLVGDSLEPLNRPDDHLRAPVPTPRQRNRTSLAPTISESIVETVMEDKVDSPMNDLAELLQLCKERGITPAIAPRLEMPKPVFPKPIESSTYRDVLQSGSHIERLSLPKPPPKIPKVKVVKPRVQVPVYPKSELKDILEYHIRTEFKPNKQRLDLWEECHRLACLNRFYKTPRVVRRSELVKPEPVVQVKPVVCTSVVEEYTSDKEIAEQIKDLTEFFAAPKPQRKSRKPDMSMVTDVQGHVGGEGSHLDSQAQTLQADNVVLQNVTEESVVTIPKGTRLLRRLAQSTTQQKFTEASDRWSIGTSIKWSTGAGRGVVLKRFVLPRDFVTEFYDAEQMAGFNFFKYFDCDNLVFRLTCVANPFVVGNVQVAWYYATDCDDKFDMRLHPATISTMEHALFNAASSNDVELRIPFKNFRSFLSTRPGSELGQLNLGEVIISILNPLGIPTGATPHVYLVPHMRIEGARFNGMISRSVFNNPTVTGQMFPAALVAYELYRKYADKNRDKEPVSTNPGPIKLNFGNLATGTGVGEHLNMLRLDARGQTPHPDGTSNEMSVDHIVKTFGYVKTIVWSASSGVGSLIECFDAAPAWDLSEYEKIWVKDQHVYYMPPVAVISQCFLKWRGSLELRLDVIATRYHVGKLMVAYVPDDQAVTFIEAKAGLCAEFSLAEGNTQFSLEIPYISDVPFWERKWGTWSDTRTKSPGRVCIFIMTPLSQTQTVTENIDINVYWRAGSDFEVAIPAPPSVGLGFMPDEKTGKDVHRMRLPAGYFPTYAGSWDDFEGGRELVLRWGAITQRISQSVGSEMGYYYRMTQETRTKVGDTNFKWGTTTLKYADAYYVPINVNDGNGYIYVGVCSSEEQAKLYWCERDSNNRWKPRGAWNTDHTAFTWAPNNDECADVPAAGTSDNQMTPDNVSIEFDGVRAPGWPTIRDPRVVSAPGHVGEQTATVPSLTIQGVGATGAWDQFGENFHDLKDLLRRYVLIRDDIVKLASYKRTLILRIPLLPAGIPLFKDRLTEYQNIWRDGSHAVVASAYRFFRGGMRIKIVCDNLAAQYSQASITLEATHVPDYHTDDIQVFKSEESKSCRTSWPQGYASTFTVTGYNPVLEFEVPFYMSGEYGFLQPFKTELLQYSSLGTIWVTARSNVKTAEKMQFSVYASIADDMRFSSFVGFPPVFPLYERGHLNRTVENDLTEAQQES